jgi:2-hydroxychromene-2-carboxylate isomerase
LAAPIEFYFDFSSPYGYFASLEVDALAARHGRAAAWRPILLGVVFKTTGQSPLLLQPLRGAYAKRDLARTARRLGVPYTIPAAFPINAIAASRAFYWLHDRDPTAAVAFAHKVFAAIFAEGHDMSPPAAVIDLARTEGLAQALDDPAVKARLKDEVDRAMALGVFGSPTLVIDGEPFWGYDRFSDAERWLATGGW